MFKHFLDENPHKNNRLSTKKRHKRKRKINQNKQIGAKKDRKRHNKLSFAMSDWAENFASAANWQLKHQLAYWKARAKSLEYENKVLHDIIRKKYYVATTSERSARAETESEEDKSDDTEDIGDEDEDFEVSEEFIQFLTANAKYKEEARLEKERLKVANEAKENFDAMMEEAAVETAEQRQERLKELYGSDWQRISALEAALNSKYIDESDRLKPVYWPHLPFNLNYS
ncbi:gem-associated protein 8-like [Galleria mellonella]|uniref:Gem-associated protein 8-like n=1 Tax=Galleria mellonella TaxID=7137 RepID=A0A6J1WFB8_GALME|nr:gem-associated protein 8-like [Galleria mellonella]